MLNLGLTLSWKMKENQVRNAINAYWETRIVEQAKVYSSLQFLNLGGCHPLLHLITGEERGVHRLRTRLNVATGKPRCVYLLHRLTLFLGGQNFAFYYLFFFFFRGGGGGWNYSSYSFGIPIWAAIFGVSHFWQVFLGVSFQNMAFCNVFCNLFMNKI